MTTPEANTYAPWDQYPGESGGDYALFAYFRDLGIARTLTAVQRAHTPGYSYAYVVGRAHGWAWKARAEAFDLWQVQERERSMAKLRAEHADRWSQDQIEIAELQTQIVKAELQSLRKRQADGETIRPNELARLIEVLHRNQNLATGKPTDRVDNQIDLSNASDETIARLEAMRGELEAISKQGA